MKKFLVIILISYVSLAQEREAKIDSLCDLFTRIINMNSTDIGNENTNYIKCGFELINNIKFASSLTSDKLKYKINKILSRPNTDTSIVTPGGFFRLHYNSTGNETPKYNISDFAKALDSAYNFEVNFLGYPPPPKDNGFGGDDKYDVYIINLGGMYGYTESETEMYPGSLTFTSFIVVDNDFSGFYTTGINAAKVTAAHEFFHAIQMGNYILRRNNQDEIIDAYFYELCSTAMEEFVFDDVNDYYGYMKSYFNNTDKVFTLNNGYNLAIWNIYLQKKYGFNVLKKQWEYLKTSRALLAIDYSLNDVGSDFSKAYSEFGIWTFFTNYRTIPNKYFKESEKYPLVRHTSELSFTVPVRVVNINALPSSNNFIRFVNKSSGKNDSLTVLLSNSNIQNAISNPSVTSSCEYSLSSANTTGFKQISDYYFRKVSSDELKYFAIAEVLNNLLIEGTETFSNEVSYVYPSPFKYDGQSNYISIPVELSDVEVEISVFTISNHLVCSFKKNCSRDNNGNWVVTWNGKNSENQKLPTGVYLYSIKNNNKVKKGKLVIINE